MAETGHDGSLAVCLHLKSGLNPVAGGQARYNPWTNVRQGYTTKLVAVRAQSGLGACFASILTRCVPQTCQIVSDQPPELWMH